MMRMESDLPPGSCNSTGHLSTIGYHSFPGRMHHSASTPAGVDGAGAAGGARTPPATPKKGGKMLAIRIQMLDDSISMFQIQSKAFGRVLFDQVCRQLHLLEADYFGLEYLDANGNRYWLDVEKPICAQVGLSMLEPTLRFCVKFYTPDPARLEEEFTRYLFCLQVKRDLAMGSIQCNENTAALMASYIVQAECGDFVPEDYPDHTYLSGYKFFPGQDAESERRIMENHKKHIGQSPAEADLNLLETARRCEFYGIKMHPTKDHENVPLNLAVAHMGIFVFQNYTKINTFSWAKIRKISFKRKKFIIKLHPEGYGYCRDMVEFFFEGRNECKNFWKKCVENHGFFRCSSVPKAPRQKTRVMSRGSSFRYSGKTQKQIIEYVRDNYVKRQTFQRSGSFRAPRSLRCSRHDVAAVSTSVSAHPLLPLPPGSDAISLEWDKQPHYLEASLMMKGYSAEEAREAAQRPNRLAHTARPAHAAALRDKHAGPEVVTHAEVNHHPTEDSPLPHRTTTRLISPESTWSRRSSRRDSAGTRDTRDTRDTWVTRDTPDTPHTRDTPDTRARTPSPAPEHSEVTSPEEDHTVSSASLLLSPWRERSEEPLSASTPMHGTCNGILKLDRNSNCEEANNNVNENGNLVAESTNSIDVLSAGGSEVGDTLRSQKNNTSISSNMAAAGRDTYDRGRRRAPSDFLYYFAKELLMTERTYKRDLELLTVSWSLRVSSLAHCGAELLAALGRPCLALEPLALAQGAFLVALERCMGGDSLPRTNENEEPEYKKVPELLYEYLSSTYDAYNSYISRAGAMLGRLESARRAADGAAGAACSQHEASSPLPLACSLLRPLHVLLHYQERVTELSRHESVAAAGRAGRAGELLRGLGPAAEAQLRHAEQHAALCALQRALIGYDKLLVADREFLRMGCVYKHSTKGLQQRMLFLFTDIMVFASKCSGGEQFRAHGVLAVRALALRPGLPPHSFTVTVDETSYVISASTEQEFQGWWRAIEDAADAARERPACVDTALTPYEQDVVPPASEEGGGGGGGAALAGACWHRGLALSRDHLHLAMRTQLSGYLLRKFKKSMGWQRLWVVLAAAALHFYKGSHDPKPLVALPVLGYTVGPPAESDGINKDFVFKLQFKNHVYFFRADSQYSYDRWTETLGSVAHNVC